jgi:hypothetical protein
MLLSKALQMQQVLEDKKNKIIIEGLENKIKNMKLLLKRKISYSKQWKVPLQKRKARMLD